MVLTVGDVMGALSRGILCLMGRRRAERSLGSKTFLSFLRGVLPVVSLILLVVFMGGVLADSAEAASSTVVLVSKFNRTTGSEFYDYLSIYNQTQYGSSFTTGYVGGERYRVSEVVVKLVNASDVPAASIYTFSSGGIYGRPADKLYDLINATVHSDRVVFTAPENSTPLHSDRSYSLVVGGTADGFFGDLAFTDDPGHDPHGIIGENLDFYIPRSYAVRTNSGSSWSVVPGYDVFQYALVGVINVPPSGKPVITGTFTFGAGEILTADVSGILDQNGLPNSFSYQWVRVDGGVETDISGETGSTYTTVSDDVNKQLKVRVGFTDNDGFAEGPLVSDAVLLTPAILVSNLDKGVVCYG